MIVPRREIDGAADGDSGGNGAQTDRAAADDDDTISRLGTRASQPVDGNGQRFDKAGRTDIQAGRQTDQTAFGNDNLFGHAAIAADPED